MRRSRRGKSAEPVVITGRSPHKSTLSKSVPLRVTATVGDPYGSPRPHNHVEIRVDRGKGCRIVYVDPQVARRLAYALIEVAAEVQANEERVSAFDKGFDKGIDQGLADGKREAQEKRRTKRSLK